jgi:hypothetical protein
MPGKPFHPMEEPSVAVAVAAMMTLRRSDRVQDQDCPVLWSECMWVFQVRLLTGDAH